MEAHHAELRAKGVQAGLGGSLGVAGLLGHGSYSYKSEVGVGGPAGSGAGAGEGKEKGKLDDV